MDKITDSKLDKYTIITQKALDQIVIAHKNKPLSKEAKLILDMATRYFEDSKHFRKKGDYINAFACLNYAHGWLDAGASLKLFDVHDSKLFTVD
ncbi:MAG: DUF357 domain-containing protein [Candidatus Woesearchaeota archaeon]